MTKPSRPIASAVLVSACVLLPAGFFSHGHDDGDFGGHDHHCTVCCLRDHSTVATAAVPAPAAPVPPALVAASTRRRRGFRTAPDPRSTRGPPA